MPPQEPDRRQQSSKAYFVRRTFHGGPVSRRGKAHGRDVSADQEGRLHAQTVPSRPGVCQPSDLKNFACAMFGEILSAGRCSITSPRSGRRRGAPACLPPSKRSAKERLSGSLAVEAGGNWGSSSSLIVYRRRQKKACRNHDRLPAAGSTSSPTGIARSAARPGPRGPVVAHSGHLAWAAPPLAGDALGTVGVQHGAAGVDEDDAARIQPRPQQAVAERAAALAEPHHRTRIPGQDAGVEACRCRAMLVVGTRRLQLVHRP